MNTEQLRQLGGRFGHARRRQINFVNHRNNFQTKLAGQTEHREGLGLDALSGVNQKNHALHCFERPRNLVGKINVAGSIDEV